MARTPPWKSTTFLKLAVDMPLQLSSEQLVYAYSIRVVCVGSCVLYAASHEWHRCGPLLQMDWQCVGRDHELRRMAELITVSLGADFMSARGTTYYVVSHWCHLANMMDWSVRRCRRGLLQPLLKQLVNFTTPVKLLCRSLEIYAVECFKIC